MKAHMLFTLYSNRDIIPIDHKEKSNVEKQISLVLSHFHAMKNKNNYQTHIVVLS